MGIRKDAVNYITWGILLAIVGILILFIKFAASLIVVYIVIGGIIVLVGLGYLKKKPIIGIALIVVGGLTILGKTLGSGALVNKLLSIGGWIALIGGGAMVLYGIMVTKKNT
mgnify:CR=1 FL=1